MKLLNDELQHDCNLLFAINRNCSDERYTSKDTMIGLSNLYFSSDSIAFDF